MGCWLYMMEHDRPGWGRWIPSRERSHIPPKGKSENHRLKSTLKGGYISSPGWVWFWHTDQTVFAFTQFGSSARYIEIVLHDLSGFISWGETETPSGPNAAGCFEYSEIPRKSWWKWGGSWHYFVRLIITQLPEIGHPKKKLVTIHLTRGYVREWTSWWKSLGDLDASLCVYNPARESLSGWTILSIL